MLLVFWIIFFTACNIMEGVSGWEGVGGQEGVGGRRGRVRIRRRAKETIWTQAAVLCPQYGARIGTIHRVGQDCHQEQLGTPCNPINAPQGREIHPCGVTASVKSCL